MNRKGERYVIRGGEAGYRRLLLLAIDRKPDTIALFRRAGLKPGARCVDVGCGGGEVTHELAKLVSPGGTVIGIDMDEVKLELARRAAVERELANVEFRKMDVRDWSEPEAYDAVYSRFLLQHLTDPVGLLQRMWAAIRSKGVLMVEDADFDGCFCDPPNEAFDFFVRTYSRVLDLNGGDHAIGRKLHRYFLEAGISDPQVNLVQPVRREGEVKALPVSTLDASSEAIVAAGLATPTEIDGALANLAAFAADPLTDVSGPRIFQVWSRR
jgi:ubiquinone/menaquinone biosynthesis C-methylase UbiE